MDDTRAAELRPYRPGDEEALMRVCLETGWRGVDATAIYTREPHLLSEIYLLPYLSLAPDLATVVAASDEPPVGYVLGALDTAAFDAAAEESWWPPLRERYPVDAHADDFPESVLVEHIHEPASTSPELLAEFPSHLHIDLLPEVQGQGYGRRLLERLFDQLAAAGSPGVHLDTSVHNTRAIAFYRAMGFDEWPTDRTSTITFVRRI